MIEDGVCTPPQGQHMTRPPMRGGAW
jgi:hypothetical protein